MMEPRVSVVVPVYNAMPYLVELMDSLAGQDLDPASFQVIAVDDGSTDAGAALLDDYAARHVNITVIHQPNSGAPGAPRNAGLRAATGRYVFFADGDDILGTETLRRLVEFADAHTSDIVIPKLTPVGKRGLPAAVYKRTLIDADVVTAFKTLFPQKLYRRTLLMEHHIVFPEGPGQVEDAVFNARAFVQARRISIVTGYDYYFLRAREDGKNFSSSEPDPAAYSAAIVRICRIVREHLNATTAELVIADLYCRKCLNRYHRGRLSTYDEATRAAWVDAHKAFAEEFVSDAMAQALESPFRERTALVRRSDVAGLVAMGEAELREKLRLKGERPTAG